MIYIYTYIYIIGKKSSLDSIAHLIHPKLILEYADPNLINLTMFNPVYDRYRTVKILHEFVNKKAGSY